MGSQTRPQDDLVVIGELGRPHGVDGELRAYPTGPTFGTLTSGARLVATARDGARVDLTLAGARAGGPGVLLVAFGEIASREQAAGIVGAVVAVPADDLPTLAEADEFYVRELIGCTVRLMPGERPLGSVVRVYEGAANDTLEVRSEQDERVYVPFTHDAIVRFDRVARTMDVRADLFGGEDA